MAERKKYDMQQALMMQGTADPSSRINHKEQSGRPRPRPREGERTLCFHNDKVNKVLQKLDRAEELAATEKLEEASALYQDSIAALIEIMKTSNFLDTGTHHKSTPSGSSLNLEVLKQRTKVALTDAERIKARITMKHSNMSQKKKVVTNVESAPATTESRGLMGFLRGKSKSEKVIVKKEEKDPIPTLKMSKSTDGRININANNMKPAANTKNMNVQPKSTSHSHSPRNNKSISKSIQRSNLNYKTNDPFIETIKKDMYVDSKTLTISWADISGLAEPKQALQEAAILPLLRPDLYTGLRAAPRGILLYGPPGTGKTMLVKAVAHESECILFTCSASSMTSKWVGEGEKLVRTLFRMAADVAPSIVFLDEIDALLSKRKSDNSEQESSRRFKTEFMVQMDGIAAGSGDSQNKTLLIGCTNCPWDIDDAIMRRFQRRIYVPLPDRSARHTLWKKLLAKSKGSVKVSTKDIDRLVKLSQGFSGSDIASIANEAAFGPLREFGIEAIKDVSVDDIRPIQMKDFERAAENTKKSVSSGLVKRYSEWEEDQAVNL